MKKLHIDIETYSEEKIGECGLYRYAMSPSFRILLVAYAQGSNPTQIIDLAQGEDLPVWFIEALTDPDILKVAHNAAFERCCFSITLRRSGLLRPDEWLDPMQWECTMVKASRCGLPLSLKDVGKALDFDAQKMSEGKDLIKLFCTPHDREDRLFDNSRRVLPEEHPDDWATFKAYCIRDVDVEREIDDALAWYKVSDFERRLYAEDQHINDRGCKVDMQLVHNAMKADAIRKADLNVEAQQITGLVNPNSVAQLREWFSARLGRDIATLTKKDIPDLMAETAKGSEERRVLEIRAEMGKTSNKKYETIDGCVCPDDRVRGLFQFYGSRTGRWAGRLVQMQNLPQNHIEALDGARKALRESDIDTLELCFGNVPDTLSQLIRTAFVAKDGYTFAVCDFSAIEARVIAWLAGEEWVLDTFRKGGDIYCATASQMFGVPVEKHGQNAGLRQKGKIAVLALGYGGGVSALEAMGGKRLGLTEEEETEIVEKWRTANPNIVRLWRRIEDGAKAAVATRTRHIMNRKVKDAVRATANEAATEATRSYSQYFVQGKGLVFDMKDNALTIELPSGRKLVYQDMEPCTNRFGNESLRYKGTNQATKAWGWVETYGGKLTENVVQAIARDCLAETMLRVADLLRPVGGGIVAHVHDELICEVPDESWLPKIQEIFAITPEGAEGLPLKGAGYVTPYYLKD